MAETSPLLVVERIEKSFPGVHALKGVSLDLGPGEIHAVIGENGAGKSTLMRLLAGLYRPDGGRILVGGEAVELRSPHQALELGIAMVYQDTRLVPTLDVAWNIALGRGEASRMLADRGAMAADARAALSTIGAGVEVSALAGDLSRAEQQQVEIARALSRDARVLILDEPTSALTSAETVSLFDIVRDLKAGGTAILFISHRMPEVLALADRISVLRDGKLVGTIDVADATSDRLVSMMVGRTVELAYPPRSRQAGEPLLAVEDLSAEAVARKIGFTLRKGEILGFGGVQGAGQSEAARALFGIGRMEGRMMLDGRPIEPRSPAEAIRAGVIYVPADRRSESLFLPHGVRENVALPHLADWTRLALVDRAREEDAVLEQAKALDIRMATLEQSVALLSGGNQQKVVFARWFLSTPLVYVFDEPTQGVDVGTKLELYRQIRGLAGGGAGIIVISSDLLELIGLTDRILVFSQGRVVDEVGSSEATEERIIGSAVTAVGGDAEIKTNRRGSQRPFLRRYGPAIMLALLSLALIVATTLATPYFLTPRNLASIGTQVAPLALAALGQLSVILLGGIDLSIGPVISLTTAIASYCLAPEATVPVGIGIATCLAAGALVGAVNALLIVRLRIPDLVATLSSFSVVQGLALILRPSPGGTIDPDVMAFFSQRLGMVPLVFLVALGLYLVAEILLLRGRVGASLYAAGASEEAARAVGLSPDRIRSLAYIFSGIMAALAGLVIASRIGSGDPQAGTTFTLAAITAVVVGGTSVFGGSGTAVGTLLGALLIILVQNVLNQLHVSAYWQYVWTGALTLAAVSFHALSTHESRAAMLGRLRDVFAHRGASHGQDSTRGARDQQAR